MDHDLDKVSPHLVISAQISHFLFVGLEHYSFASLKSTMSNHVETAGIAAVGSV